MMTRRLMTLLACGALLLATPTTAAGSDRTGSPASSSRVALAGKTVVDASKSGKIAVRLPKPVAFEVPGPRTAGSFAASGKGRLIGFALVADGSDPGRVVISGARATDSRDVKSSMAISHTSALALGADRWILPAGDYSLYVVTDGEPIRIVFTFKGLPGTVEIVPNRPAAAQVSRPLARYLPQGQQTAGAYGELGGPGILMTLTTTEHEFSQAQHYLNCVYAGDGAKRALHAPGCPDADQAFGPVLVNANVERTLVHHVGGTFYAGHDPLPLAQGYSLTNAGLNEHIEYTAMWLTF